MMTSEVFCRDILFLIVYLNFSSAPICSNTEKRRDIMIFSGQKKTGIAHEGEKLAFFEFTPYHLFLAIE